MIDLVDGQAIFSFEKIERQQSAADCASCALTQFRDLIRYGTVCRDTSARSVGDPIFGGAINGADTFIADHKSADVTPGLVDVFLNIKNLVIDSQR